MAEPNPNDATETNDIPGTGKEKGPKSSCNKNTHGVFANEEEYSMEISRQFQQGYSREQTFINMCFIMNIPQAIPAQIAHFFQCMENNEGINMIHLLNEYYPVLAHGITEEFKKLQNGIALWSSKTFDFFKFLDSRYAVAFKRTNTLEIFQFVILDNYYGQEKEIPIEGELLPIDAVAPLQLEVINSEYLLLFDYITSQHEYTLYLFHLNLEQGKCTLLDINYSQEELPKVIRDSKNPLKFAFCWFDAGDPHVQLAGIENSKLVVEPVIYLHDDPLSIFRLEDNTVQALLSGFDPEDPNLDFFMDLYLDDQKDDKFGEFTLISGQDYPSIRRLFDIKREGRLNGTGLQNVHWRWSKNVCVAIGKEEESSNKLEVLVIDLDIRTVVTTNHYLYCCGSIEDIHLDEDGILSVCFKYTSNKQLVVHRLPLKQPDTLFNLAFFKMRRDVVFFGSQQYDKLLSNLPNIMQPLSVLPSNKENLKSTHANVPSELASCSNMDLVGEEPVKKRQKTG